MMLKLLYFARLREAFERSGERVEAPPPVVDVAALTRWLRSRGGAWEAELAPEKPVRVAVNQVMANGASPLKAGDEVAFFPPVTGG